MQTIKKILVALVLTLSLAGLAAPAFAATVDLSKEAKTWNVNGKAGEEGLIEGDQAKVDSSKGIVHVIDQIIIFGTGIISTVCVFMIIVGAVIITGSAHNEDNMKKGKDMVTWAIIGLVVVLCSYAIVSGVQAIIYSS